MPQKTSKIIRDKTPVYIARHGENSYDEKEIAGGQDQPGLSDKGKRQMKTTVHDWKGKGITKILTSDAARAKQSAQIVAEGIKSKVIIDKRLRTQDIGDLEGGHEEVVAPMVKDINDLDPDEKVGGTGESFNEFKKRVKEGYLDNLKKNKSTTNAFVLHGDVIQLLKSDFGKDMDAFNGEKLEHGETIELPNPIKKYVTEK